MPETAKITPTDDAGPSASAGAKLEKRLETTDSGLRQRKKIESEEDAAQTIQAAARGKQGRSDMILQRVNTITNTVKTMPKKFKLSPGHKLLTDPETRKVSMRVVMLACFVDVCCSTVCAPNYNFMCTPGAHPDSFPDTKPFDIGMAINLIPASGAIGKIIASAVIVKLSNKIGRKNAMLICLFMGAVGCVLKFIARKSYWAFIAANFFNGLFGASIIVGMAYVNDVYGDNPGVAAKETEGLIGLMILGGSIGNFIAIGLEGVGLFEGLLVGAGGSVLVCLSLMKFMIEPDHGQKKDAGKSTKYKQDGDDDHHVNEEAGPKETDKKLLYKIIFGSCLDSLGSAGPPLMFSLVFYIRYYATAVFECDGYRAQHPEGLLLLDPANPTAGNITAAHPLQLVEDTYCTDPVIAATEYKWFDTLVMVSFFGTIALMAPALKKFGPAGTCVLGNFLTAVFTAVLYILAKEPDPSRTMMIVFISSFYTCNVLTTLSLVTTQPMINAVVKREEQPGAQALNQQAQDLMAAVTPLLFSYILDSQGAYFFMWFALACSLIATLVNLPLTAVPALGAKAYRDMMDAAKPQNEDALKADLTPDGEGWIPQKELNKINDANFQKSMETGEPFEPVKLKYGAYDAEKLSLIKSRALDDFSAAKEDIEHWIEIAKDPQQVKNIVAAATQAMVTQRAFFDEQKKDAGAWMADYLEDVGYGGELSANPTLFKMMIRTAFPPLLKPGSGGKPTEENVRMWMVRSLKFKQEMIHSAHDRRHKSIFSAFGKTGVTLGA